MPLNHIENLENLDPVLEYNTVNPWTRGPYFKIPRSSTAPQQLNLATFLEYVYGGVLLGRGIWTLGCHNRIKILV